MARGRPYVPQDKTLYVEIITVHAACTVVGNPPSNCCGRYGELPAALIVHCRVNARQPETVNFAPPLHTALLRGAAW